MPENMERAARMLEAWPRFHDDASHHTYSIRIGTKSNCWITSATAVPLWPRVITTRSMPAECTTVGGGVRATISMQHQSGGGARHDRRIKGTVRLQSRPQLLRRWMMTGVPSTRSSCFGLA